ncbi:MAG: pentapeptide repeat-containing protein [Sulfurimonas sp.]|nr:pentapeptide repeat-containing protein [Sulfurimonas sp.]
MSFKKDEYYDEVIENINLNEQQISSIEFDNCTFKSCSFNKSTFAYCKFTECIFENCDLSLLIIKGSVFNDVQLIDTKAIGINWTSASSPFEINFKNSDISMSSFYNFDLRQAKIINCKANDVDFAKTNLEKVDFKDTDLKGSIFGDTNLKNADLSQAINYMIDPNQNKIQGTKVSLPQATSFLEFFELKII